ncbi:MAG: hypothetical protein ACLSHC_07740 [Bilophila wadsworthia]
MMGQATPVHHGAPRKQSLSLTRGRIAGPPAGYTPVLPTFEEMVTQGLWEETGQHHEYDECDEEAQKQLLDAGQRHVRFLMISLCRATELADVGPNRCRPER